MKRVLSLILIMMLVLALVACGGDDLIGKWEAKDVKDMEDIGLSLTVEFTENQMKMMGIDLDYEVKGDNIILNFMGQEQEIAYKVSGDTLTLTVDGVSQEFKRVDE